MINYVMLTNLERSIDRFYFALGRLSAVGVDIKSAHTPIVRHIAHDGRDYASEEEVREAAIADGFAEFESYDYLVSRTRAAWWWTWRCALRHIIELDAVLQGMVLLLIDDWMPRPQWTWDRIVGLAGAASRFKEHGFRIIQLLGSQYSDEVTHSTIIEEAHNCAIIPEGLGYNTVLRKGLGWCSKSSNHIN